MPETRTIRLTVPPDRTPEEEEELVAAVAQAIAESTSEEVEVELELQESEEVSYQAMSRRTGASDRWNR
jgi:acetylornithine deacetylase/succinyl-diaminopimelate desuccinylase-like protein